MVVLYQVTILYSHIWPSVRGARKALGLSCAEELLMRVSLQRAEGYLVQSSVLHGVASGLSGGNLSLFAANMLHVKHIRPLALSSSDRIRFDIV